MLTPEPFMTNRRRVSEGDVGIHEMHAAQMYSEFNTEFIRLHLKSWDETKDMHYDIGKSVPLGYLKRSYCEMLRFEQQKMCFIYKGHKITNDDTACSLNMSHKDVIEIYFIKETENNCFRKTRK